METVDFTRLQQAYLLARSLAEDPKTSVLDRVAYAQIANLIAEACSETSRAQAFAIRGNVEIRTA